MRYAAHYRGMIWGAMLAKRAQRDSKHVPARLMPTIRVGMAPIFPILRMMNAVISDTCTIPRLICSYCKLLTPAW